MDADTEDGEVGAARQSRGVRVPSVPGAPRRKGRAREGDRYLGLREERTDEGAEERYRTGDEGRWTKILSHQQKCPSFILLVVGDRGAWTPRPCLDAKFFPKFHYEKEDSPSHQNVGTCMEY
jgi:hypothetical protein